MSLLIDALKQAEEARKQNIPAPGEVASPRVLSLAEEAGLSPQPPKNPTSTLRADPLQSKFASQQVARELFEAKAPHSSRLPLMLAVMGIVLFAAGALYIWHASRPINLQAIRPTASAPQIAEPPPQAETPIVVSAPVVSPTTDSMPSTFEQAAQLHYEKVRAAKESKEESPEEAFKDVKRSGKTALPVNPSSISDEGAGLIKRTQQKPAQEAASTKSAFDAYQRGDVALARARYAQVLAREPRNVDALNGLGIIALRMGQADLADQYFRRTLAIDPKDDVALAQLTSIRGASDPSRAESQLRNLIAEQPDSAIALFSLGGLFAKQNRWAEAQQAFFQAHVIESDNPDILYNLAVSLDHLNQVRLAQRYYAEAVEAAKRGAASFSIDAARERMQTLSAPSATETP